MSLTQWINERQVCRLDPPFVNRYVCVHRYRPSRPTRSVFRFRILAKSAVVMMMAQSTTALRTPGSAHMQLELIAPGSQRFSSRGEQDVSSSTVSRRDRDIDYNTLLQLSLRVGIGSNGDCNRDVRHWVCYCVEGGTTYN